MADCTNPECAAIRAELAELKRPKMPAEFGLTVHLSPLEHAIAAVLMPPGRVEHRDAIIARAWPDVAAAGLVEGSAHLLRVHAARLRGAVARAGWRLPYASSRGEYALLAPGMGLPDGFRERRTPNGTAACPDRSPCPECDGMKVGKARRCVDCHRRRRAAGKRPGSYACPTCGEWKDWDSRECLACSLARRQHRLEERAA